MAKVFINDTPVIISSRVASDLENLNHLFVQYASKDTLLYIFDYLQKNNNLVFAYIFCQDEERVWREFCSLFVIKEAAGGLVFNAQKELLMIFRNDKWDLPKGHVDAGESGEQAALREVAEECGISSHAIEKKIITTYHTFIKNDRKILKKTEWYKMNFTGNDIPTPQKDEGIEMVKWIPISQLDDPLKNSYSSIRFLIKEVVANQEMFTPKH